MPVTLIDGFESWSGGLPAGWEVLFGVVAQSTSNVTQGLYSVKVTGVENSFLQQDTFQNVDAGTYLLDVYLVSGSLSFGVDIGGSGPEVYTITPGAQTISLEVTSSGLGQFYISTPDGSEVYIDNLRLIADDIFEPSTKVFTLTPENLSFLGDQNLIISAPKEFIFNYGMVFTAPDWLSADWLAADWDTDVVGVRFFNDEVADLASPKEFELVFNTSVFFADSVLPSGTKEFELGFETLAFFGDQYALIADPKEFELALAADLDFYTGHRFEIPTTDFTLEPQDVEFYFELYRSFPVINSSEFKYELLGVSVETEEGAGRFTVFTGNDILVSDVPYTTTATNTALSGIIERGENLTILVYMQNAYFRSFKADFAMKRIYE